MKSPFTLEGKAALVTGSGRGIGRAIADRLAASGASVLVNDVDEDSACETESRIRKEGGTAEHLAGDLTNPEFPEKLVKTALERLGGLDIVVNNAGYSWDTVIQKTTDEQFQAMLDIHLVTPFRILRAASQFFRETAKKEIAEGRRVMRKVVNITSIAGTDGNPGQVGYSSGQGRGGRVDENAGEGVGALQHQRQLRGVRTHRDPIGSAVDGNVRDRDEGAPDPCRGAGEDAGNGEVGLPAGAARHT